MRIQRRPFTAIIIGLSATALALTGCADSSAASRDGESTVAEAEVPGEKVPATFGDNTFISGSTRIAITESRVIPLGETGNEHGVGPVLAIWYEATNTGVATGSESGDGTGAGTGASGLDGTASDPLGAWLTHFRAVQHTGTEYPAELGLAVSPDEALMGGQTDPIPVGETVSNAVAYALADAEADVELIVTDSGLTEVGRQTFNVR